jgi:regulator of sigma E protease
MLIFIHEFGHFLAAKLFGVSVQRFSLGFGPRLLGKKWRETDYRISAFPLGGYVKMLGEAADEEVPEGLRHASFSHQPLFRRVGIVACGPLFNLFLAFFVYTIAFAAFGLPRRTADVGSVSPGSPAAKAGIQAGDKVLAIDGVEVKEWDQLSELIQKAGDRPVAVRLQRGSEVMTFEILPEMSKTRTLLGEEIQRPLIGIVASGNVSVERVNLLEAVYYGMDQTWQVIKLTFLVLGKLLQGHISPRTLAGPIGIAQMSGQVAEAGAAAFLSFLALLSINLGILNLLPIPVLDGGHLLFFLIEAVMGRPLSMRKREMAQQVGLFLLVALMVFVFYNDIYRLLYPGRLTP